MTLPALARRSPRQPWTPRLAARSESSARCQDCCRRIPRAHLRVLGSATVEAAASLDRFRAGYGHPGCRRPIAVWPDIAEDRAVWRLSGRCGLVGQPVPLFGILAFTRYLLAFDFFPSQWAFAGSAQPPW